MKAEKDLKRMLKGLSPKLQEGEYIFYTHPKPSGELMDASISSFKEEEGLSLILPKEVADQHELSYDFVAVWISLEIHSALDAVGLTAAFSAALTKHNISCNVVAAYHHDHIFVDQKDGTRTIEILEQLSQSA